MRCRTSADGGDLCASSKALIAGSPIWARLFVAEWRF
jgi:hypothetical protein